MKISYYSLGCKVNLYESEAVINQFLENGYILGEFNDICDVYLINTCSITQVSDAKSRKIIRQAVKNNPQAIVAVMGCYAQLKPEDVKKIDGVDVLIGTSNRDKLFSLVTEAQKKKQIIQMEDNIFLKKDYEELKINRFTNKTRGFVKVQDGCDNYCSYCTIPFARGHIRSRKAKDVIEEITILSKQNVKEIVLSGINTGSYGRDLENYRLADLLNDIIQQVPNLGRIRISSIEMTEVTEQLLSVIFNNKQFFCNHLHIPLQGGVDHVLKRMNRRYTISEYQSKITNIRFLLPEVNITTDILAGFAGESEEEFENTYSFIESMNFGEMHVFPYSPRPLTKAYNFPDHINDLVKQIRVSKLLELNKKQALKYRSHFLNKIVDVLIEKKDKNIAYGHTSNYLEVQFLTNANINEIVKVLITDIDYPICKGVQK